MGESERVASQLQRDGPAWAAGALAAACVKLQLSAAQDQRVVLGGVLERHGRRKSVK